VRTRFVQKNILNDLAPRLRELDRGSYARSYRRAGKSYPGSLHLALASILDGLGIGYERGSAAVPGTALVPDFVVGSRLVFVDREMSPGELASLSRSGRRCLLITRSATRSDRLDAGIRAVQLGDGEAGRLQSVFLDDPSFNFDYAHILPKTEKCSVMHGHTSSALVEIVGTPRDGMVIDFNDAKPIIKKAIADLDHKLFIDERYVTGETKTHVDLSFETVHGEFSLRVPKETTVLLEGEATVENLAQELLRRIAPKMPENVEAVGVYVYEGLNKGTHLLARLHTREAEKRRKP
jgi:6-pyruvoyltetrahydropterin/6-carboxytetrahydropterin synthase